MATLLVEANPSESPGAGHPDLIAMKDDIRLLGSDMREMELRLRHDLTLRLGGAVVAATGVVIGVLRALITSDG